MSTVQSVKNISTFLGDSKRTNLVKQKLFTEISPVRPDLHKEPAFSDAELKFLVVTKEKEHPK